MAEQIRKLIGVILLVALTTFIFYKPFQLFFTMPSTITVFEGEDYHVEKLANVNYSVNQSDDVVQVENTEAIVAFSGVRSGQAEMTLEVSGIPMKKVNIDVLNEIKVVPGGQSIGIKLNPLGVLVVGHHLVQAKSAQVSPGEKADIQVGDIITSINDQKVTNMKDISQYIDEAGETGKPLQLSIRRGEEELERELEPVFDENEQMYKVGMYIRDSAAGIGTMTFIDPKSQKYGALGHIISDMDTKKPIVVDDGQIVQSTVTSIEKGKNGNPGEKLARFDPSENIIGSIHTNSPFGIFGKMNATFSNGISNEALPITLPHEVKKGPAKILTVVEGNQVEEFDVEIVSSIEQTSPATKGLVVKITDEKLLAKTGGIVQGMSGSPIIQDGKLVGAVTHVFVNDPTQGYGIHIEWMLKDAGIHVREISQAS